MDTLSLHTCTVHHLRATINKTHILFHFIAILALLYYRISHIFSGENVPVFTWGLMTMAELTFTFLWVLMQAFRWRPVTRTVSLENFPANVELPGVDVFVCTADPKKEPVVEVMNTVLSAMALDYPPEKLTVYLSDDGGAASTLYAMKEACSFARSWLPFCRKYRIKTRCPGAFFSSFGDDDRVLRSDEFKIEEENMKSKHEVFKKNVEKAGECGGINDSVVHDRPPCIEVIHDNSNGGEKEDTQTKMPNLVYVSREKRPSRPHRFKAGALNALLRVSGIMSNGKYTLVLDCDMYCNDPTSVKQAMCFHLDPNMSSSLAFVQYPQIFFNVSKNDIYDGQARSAYKTKYQGMDGIGGTVCMGTGYYLNKKALYSSPNQQDEFLLEREKNFGLSSKFINSLEGKNEESINGDGISSVGILEEARILASCAFEENTRWGKEANRIFLRLFAGEFVHRVPTALQRMEIGLSLSTKAMFLGLHHHRHERCLCSTNEMVLRIVTSRSFGFQPSHIWNLKDVHSSKYVLWKHHTVSPLRGPLRIIWHHPSVVLFIRHSLVPQGFKPMVYGICNSLCILPLSAFLRSPL
ncbi:hypothetical protein LguiA_001234 [Lonicera macranthoides]